MVYYWGELPSRHLFLVMEFIEGQSLAERLHLEGRVPILATVQIIRQLAASIDFAHQNQIIHRDIKPGNVILHPDASALGGERPKLLDFGIAKALTRPPAVEFHTTINTIMGTPAYMSPEQCKASADVTPASDVYSLGIVFYEMLSGSRPFTASDSGIGELLGQHLFAEVQPVRERNPAVPERVARFLHKMLAKSPDDRPKMSEVLAEMDTLLASGILTQVDSKQTSEKPPISHELHPSAITNPSGAPFGKKRPAIFYLIFFALCALLYLGYFTYHHFTSRLRSLAPTSRRYIDHSAGLAASVSSDQRPARPEAFPRAGPVRGVSRCGGGQK